MDNRTADITSKGREALEMAVKILWPNGNKAVHYKIVNLVEEDVGYRKEYVERDDGTPTLILLWAKGNNTQPLPYTLDLNGTIHFIDGWLNTVEYGPQPDHDGDNSKGFRVFADFWGQVANQTYGFIGVQPVWAMHGK